MFSKNIEECNEDIPNYITISAHSLGSDKISYHSTWHLTFLGSMAGIQTENYLRKYTSVIGRESLRSLRPDRMSSTETEDMDGAIKMSHAG